jgi:transcriptional regulator with XRE-family HTH domain
MTEQEIKVNFARNLTAFRKNARLTQLQLAEKLNYSDKAVSKWECGDTLPDVATLSAIAEFFSVSIDELIACETPKKRFNAKEHVFITLLSCGLSFLVFSIVFLTATLMGVPDAWMLAIYMIPATSIVAIVFAAIWFGHTATEIAVSALVWSLGLSLFLTLLVFAGLPAGQLWFIFIVCAIIQLLVLLFFGLLKNKKNQ